MFGLYRAVTSRGGFIDRPHARKNLSMVEIFREMANHYDGHTYTDIGTLLLNTYQKTFSEYEEEHPQDRNVAKCAVCGDAPPRCRKTGFSCESPANDPSNPTKPKDWRLCAACGILTHAECQTAGGGGGGQGAAAKSFACDACVTGATVARREERRRARQAANVKGSGGGNKHAAGRRDREREKRDRERREADKQQQTTIDGQGRAALGVESPGRKRSRGGERIRLTIHQSNPPTSRPSGRSGGLMPNVADAVAEAAAEMVAEESADRRRAEEAVSAAAAAIGGAHVGSSLAGGSTHGFTRDFGYHHETYRGSVATAGVPGPAGGYGPPRYVQGYPQGFAYHSFPHPHGAHPQGAHQSSHQRDSVAGRLIGQHWQHAAVGPTDASTDHAARLYPGARPDRAQHHPPLHAAPQWVRYSQNDASAGPNPDGSSPPVVAVENPNRAARRGFKSGFKSGDRSGARRMVLRPDGALVETTGVVEGDESPPPSETLQGLSGDSPESPGDSTDPGMSVLTSLAAAPSWMPSASEANLLQRLNDELKETRENSNSPRGTDNIGGAIPRKGSDPRLVLGVTRNPSLSRFSEMERSDSLCSLGVYDSQFWSSVLDNGPDVLGSDPAA